MSSTSARTPSRPPPQITLSTRLSRIEDEVVAGSAVGVVAAAAAVERVGRRPPSARRCPAPPEEAATAAARTHQARSRRRRPRSISIRPTRGRVARDAVGRQRPAGSPGRRVAGAPPSVTASTGARPGRPSGADRDRVPLPRRGGHAQGAVRRPRPWPPGRPPARRRRHRSTSTRKRTISVSSRGTRT